MNDVSCKTVKFFQPGNNQLCILLCGFSNYTLYGFQVFKIKLVCTKSFRILRYLVNSLAAHIVVCFILYDLNSPLNFDFCALWPYVRIGITSFIYVAFLDLFFKISANCCVLTSRLK